MWVRCPLKDKIIEIERYNIVYLISLIVGNLINVLFFLNYCKYNLVEPGIEFLKFKYALKDDRLTFDIPTYCIKYLLN